MLLDYPNPHEPQYIYENPMDLDTATDDVWEDIEDEDGISAMWEKMHAYASAKR